LPVDLDSIENRAVASALTLSQQRMLEQSGFTVIHSQEEQFMEIREQVSRFHGQPYFLTTDAAYHALHVEFSELLKSLEREVLLPALEQLTADMVTATGEILSLSKGSELEQDAGVAAAYFRVPARLLGLEVPLDPEVQELVDQQLAQIRAAETWVESVIVQGFKDDYSAYKPIGHYAGDPELEKYFKAMTWYGRNHFYIIRQEPGFTPSKAPLVITMAMRTTPAGSKAAREWADLRSLISFLIGPKDDLDPSDYSELVDQVYGTSSTIVDIRDDGRWETFQTLARTLPPSRINSNAVDWLGNLEAERGWRFLGQSFTVDSFILQNLVFDRVGTIVNRRELPSGLDVMAVFDSLPAYRALEQGGHTGYANYEEQLSDLQQIYRYQDEPAWLETITSSWLYSFYPLLNRKTTPFPEFTHSEEWNTREMNAALGSWAEFKHDTALYAKPVEAAAGGGPPSSGPAPGYVEPNPLVFYRLAFVARALSEGILNSETQVPELDLEPNVTSRLNDMTWLAERFELLGDIAVKEIRGEELDSEDYRIIQSPLGKADSDATRSWRYNHYAPENRIKLPDMPVVASVAGADTQVLEVGTGKVDRIYVVVPIDGSLQIAQGGVYTYYEFAWSRQDRLTDQQWQMLLEADPPEPPEWVSAFRLPHGHPLDVLAFRPDDVYIITDEGENLNLRLEPSLSAESIWKLEPGVYVRMIGDPVSADGYSWIQLKIEDFSDEVVEGWAVQNQDWYERAWGQ
jgi:hypothetical protein